jgi:hypothetical protein
MTNSPGDWQPPQDPNQQPGYWEQQQPQQPYGQQPYGQPYGQQPGYPAAYAPDHPKATTSLVLGILGIVVCGLVAPFAWRIGKKTRDEIDASNGQLGGRGAAQAGYVLGLIGTILLALGLVLVVLLVVGSLVTATTSTVSTSSY